MANSLITRLSNLRQVIVRPTSSVSGRSLEGKQPADVGRELRVDAVLECWIQRSGDRIQLTVQLVRVQDGSMMWGDTFLQKDTDIFVLEDTLAERVAAALIPRLTGEEKRILARRYTDNPEAYQFYVMGRFFWAKLTLDGKKKAIEYFEQAIDKDPNYALAYAGLADCYRMVDVGAKEAYPKAKEYASKALKIDDSLAEAHVALATIKFKWDLDVPGADSEYRRAIELDPNYVYGHNIYAQYLACCGRFDEAAAEIKLARELDPIDRVSYRVEGCSLYFQGRYDEAIEIFRTVVEMHPSFLQAQLELALAYEEKGMYEEALKALQLLLSQPGNGFKTTNLAYIGHVYAVWGKRSEALKVIDELKEQSKQRAISPYDVAVIYAGLGEKDKALEWLGKAYEARSFSLTRMKFDPRLDNCRADPRFRELLRKIGFQ